ncbi:MAG: hypothetical protein WAT78_13485 [Rhizobiaceae bacterium]
MFRKIALAACAAMLVLGASSARAENRPVNGLVILMKPLAMAGKAHSMTTGEDGCVWQQNLAEGEYSVSARGIEKIQIKVNRFGKLWVCVSKNENGRFHVKARGGDRPVDM